MSSYSNPLKVTIPPGTDTKDCTPLYNPDPYVIKYRGHYYCYATGEQSVPVLRSENLCTWEHLGSALHEENCRSYWAPCVVYDNGCFYMYYSSIKENETDDHCHVLKLAVSDKPEGPFKYKKTFFNYFSIDAHVARDKHSWILFYSVNNVKGTDENRPGTVILEDLMIDLSTPSGHPVLAVYPTRDEEIFERNRFDDGRDWHTIEGAFYYSCGGKEFLLYSGGAYTREFYFIDYAVKNSDGLWQKKSDKTFNPLLQKNTDIEGTGHNSIAVAPNLIDTWIVYHGRNRSIPLNFNEEQRSLRIDPLYCYGGILSVPGPTICIQQGPASPSFFDSFDEIIDTHNWNTVSGRWTVSNGTLLSAQMEVSAVICQKRYDGYVMEVSLCWTPQHFGGLYGVYGAYSDERNWLELLFDAGQRLFIIRAARNGGIIDEQSVPLDTDFDPSAFHVFRVERVGICFILFLDGRELAEYEYYSGETAAVGFIAYYCSVAYDAFGITGRISFTKKTQKSFWQYLKTEKTGSWKSENGKLVVNHSMINNLLEIPVIPFKTFRLSFFMEMKNQQRKEQLIIVLKNISYAMEIQLSNKEIIFLGKQYFLPDIYNTVNGHSVCLFCTGKELTLFVDQKEITRNAKFEEVNTVVFFPNSEIAISELELTEMNFSDTQ